jgi:hypothetical protein
LTIVHKDSNNQTYANVANVRPLKPGEKVANTVSELVYFSLDPEEFSEKALASLPKSEQDRIMASETYNDLMETKSLKGKSLRRSSRTTSPVKFLGTTKQLNYQQPGWGLSAERRGWPSAGFLFRDINVITVYNLRAEAVVSDANLNGVKLIVDGDTLVAEPEDRHFCTTPLLLARLKKHRAEIIETLPQYGRRARDIESVRASFATQAAIHAEREAKRLSDNEKMPDVYLAAWARLTDQIPPFITNEVWEQTVDDGSVFTYQHGKRAASFGWSVADIFNVQG